jgi:Tol biopolymer transport system component
VRTDAAAEGEGFTPEADWAPQGDRIGFVYASGKSLVRLAKTGLFGGEIPFAWAPDGHTLAYSQCDLVGPGAHGEFDCTVYGVRDTGAHRRKLIQQHFSETKLAWSPDGRFLAVHATLRSGPDEGDYIQGSDGLYLVDLERGRTSRVPRATGEGFSWSAHGGQFAYATQYRNASAVMVSSADGKRARTLLRSTRVSYGELAWSHDGSMIAAAVSRSGPGYAPSAAGLQILDARSGTILHRVAGGYVSSPSWRPR